MSKDNSRAAFPYQHVQSPGSEVEWGMSYRQWLVGMTLPALIITTSSGPGLGVSRNEIAAEALRMVDAVIDAQDKENTTDG